MAQRDELFAHFGPLLFEGCLQIMFDEFNLLRARMGLPPRTKREFYEAITNHLSTLQPYDWMEGP